MAKSQRPTVGDVLLIELGDGTHTYGRYLKIPLVAIYDARSHVELPIDEVIARSILFKIWVSKAAVSPGRWRIVGNVPLSSDLAVSPEFFKQDAINPSRFSVYRDGIELPASRAECEKLERAAVWDAQHVEDRIRDHYAGKRNKWVIASRPDRGRSGPGR